MTVCCGLLMAWLLRGLFDLYGERLGAGPGVLGDVEQDALGPVEFLFEIAGLRIHLVAVEVMFGAEALKPLRELVDVLDQHAKMVNAAVVETLAELIGFEFEDR